MTQSQKASSLRELHHGREPLVLINAWDAASACIVEQAGFPAVATSSAAVANSLGFADGQHVPWNEMVAAVHRIARSVTVPVTADIEAGFSSSVQDLRRSLEQIIEAGAVGVNLEDALPGHGEFGPLYPVADQAARIRAARETGEKAGVPLVINARTDAFWQKGPSPEEALRNTIERGREYLQNGADCIFVPGLRKTEHISAIVQALRAPLNVLAGLNVPSIPELGKLGVKRVSFGSGPARAAMGLLKRIIQEATSSGTYKSMTEGQASYDEMNALFSK